jgi:hypothetical protein
MIMLMCKYQVLRMKRRLMIKNGTLSAKRLTMD